MVRYAVLFFYAREGMVISMESKNSILIVNDDKADLLYLSQILSADYTILTAMGVSETIETANEYRPDLILLDVVMPGADGYKAFAALKESEKTREIPVVLITEINGGDGEMNGLNLCAGDYIVKPFSDAIVKLRVQNQIRIVNQGRALEHAERNSRVKSEFLSRMSREMRTPMNAVIGMTHLAQETDDPEKRKDYLVKADNTSRNLLRLIDDVLDISDIEEGRFYLVPSEFHFAAMLQRIFDEAGLYIDEKYQALTINIDSSIPKFLICDEKRLSQVITNLLSNAGKFTGEHGLIQFKALVLRIENNFLTLQIEVIDSGIGISKEQQENLFTAFKPFDGGLNRKYGGWGLSLPISKNIVKMMDGDIWVESEPGKGSKFAFTFKAQIKTSDTEADAPASFKGKTALLVEDAEINREIVMAMLEDTRLQIVCAANGREAVELFSADPQKFDVIFMDINMPEMDGVEATRRIRALENPKAARVPIIAVTANVLQKEVKSYIDAGMTDHIGKPIDFDRFLQKISLYMR